MAKKGSEIMGYVYLYTGTGAGKTTNALGLALRSVGHGQKVVVIQFMKFWKNTGEYKIMKRLKPNYEIYQFGRGWLKLKKKGETIYKFGKAKIKVNKIEDLDKELAKKGLEFAKKVMKERKPDLLILDEINLAVNSKLLSINDVLRLLKNIPEKTTVVMTGRFADKRLIKRAEFVNEIIAVKYPEHIPSTKGIQY